MRKIALLILFSLLLFSCKQELARVDLLQNNSEEIFFELEAEEVVNLYANIDVEYKKTPLFVYNCAFYQGGELLFEGGTDPLLTTENEAESKNTKKGITHWQFYGKLEGNLKANMSGEYSIKTTFLKNDNPDLKINKAEIVFVKQ